MTTQEELARQQLLQAQLQNQAYMEAKRTGVPIPIGLDSGIAPGTVTPPTLSSDIANTSKSQLMAEAEAYAAYYGGNAYDIYNQRIDSIGPSQRYLDILAQYEVQHNAIINSGGSQYNLYPTGSGQYAYSSGELFRSNTLTQYQSQSLDSILSTPSPAVRDLLNIRGLQTMSPDILAGSINRQGYDWQTSSNLAGFLTSPEERKPYETWFWGDGPATFRTAMDAVYVGRGDSAMFAPPPGSATERFGFDEYGKVLRGGKFEPAFSSEGIPYNSKMGSGDYRYVGEYRYNTGEVVSRFYEKNVGSFVDFTKFGVMTAPQVMIRSGGSPGSFRETRDFTQAINSIPADKGTTIFTKTKSLASGVSVGGLPAPFKSTVSNSGYFDLVSRGIENAPILSNVFAFGAGVDKKTTQGIRDWVTSAPILSDVAKGGELFALKKNVDIASGSPSFNNAVDNYQTASSRMVGTGKNDSLITAPIASPFLKGGELYRTGITTPFSSFVAPLGSNPITNFIKDAATGFVGVPGGISEMIGMSISGGERLIKNPGHLPGLAAAGFAMQAEGFVSNPVQSTAALVGTYGLLAGGGAAFNKGLGIMRTRGQSYLPIEQIGYDVDVGFPLAPRGMTRTQLRSSFERSTFDPVPARMSIDGVNVPYVPRNTALPGEAAGRSYMWTAWETTPQSQVGIFSRLTGGRQYALGRGTSELPGMYGAPGAESYFLKVGGQTPATIGFNFGIKKPTLVRTAMGGIDYIPTGLSRRTMSMKARGLGNEVAYADMTRHIQQNVPAGRAALPMTKIEYEAVLQEGNVMEITGSRYYTKVGGFGERHFLGTRVPIVEQRTTGVIRAPLSENTITPRIFGSTDYSYKPDALLNAYSLAGSVGLTNMGYPLSRQTSIFSKTGEPSIGISPGKTLVSSKSTFGAFSTPTPSSSTSPGILSTLPKVSSRPPISEYSYSSYKPISTPPFSGMSTPMKTPPYSPGYTPRYTPATTPPYTPPYTPTTTPTRTTTTPPYTPTITTSTPPYTPNTPPPPPPTPIFGFPSIGGGATSSPFGRLGLTKWKRRNPVADWDYLSRGMGGKKRGKQRSIFGSGPF